MSLPRDFDLEVSRGVVAGYDPVAVVGINPAVGSTAFETMWDPGGKYVPPTSGETWELLSDNANDTILGTGLRRAVISGMDTTYNRQVEIVETNGTTPVITTRTDWFRIFAVVGISSGSSKKNEGNITLRVSGGGLIRSLMRIGQSTTFNGLFTVPSGKTLFIQQALLLIPKNEDVIVRNELEAFGTNTTVSGGDVSVYQNSAVTHFRALPTFPEKTDIEVTCKSTNTSVGVSFIFQGKLSTGTGLIMAARGF